MYLVIEWNETARAIKKERNNGKNSIAGRCAGVASYCRCVYACAPSDVRCNVACLYSPCCHLTEIFADRILLSFSFENVLWVCTSHRLASVATFIERPTEWENKIDLWFILVQCAVLRLNTRPLILWTNFFVVAFFIVAFLSAICRRHAIIIIIMIVVRIARQCVGTINR